MKVCSNCNKENNNVEGNFCVFCGGKLIEKKENKEIKKEDKSISKKEKKQKEESITTQDANKKLKIILVILVALLVIVSGVAIYFKISDNTSKLKDEIASLEQQVKNLREEKYKLSSENSSLKSTNSKNSKKIKFFDENVVFVLDGYGRYYYTYDQMAQVTQGKSFSYWAYNLEQAIDLGYRAWQQ